MDRKNWQLNDIFKYKGELFIARPCKVCSEQGSLFPCEYGDGLCLYAVKGNNVYPYCMFADGSFKLEDLEQVPSEDLAKCIIEQL